MQCFPYRDRTIHVLADGHTSIAATAVVGFGEVAVSYTESAVNTNTAASVMVDSFGACYLLPELSPDRITCFPRAFQGLRSAVPVLSKCLCPSQAQPCCLVGMPHSDPPAWHRHRFLLFVNAVFNLPAMTKQCLKTVFSLYSCESYLAVNIVTVCLRLVPAQLTPFHLSTPLVTAATATRLQGVLVDE